MNNHIIQKVLETDDNGISTIMIERDVSLKEAISILFNRKLKEIVFVDTNECIRSSLAKQ